MSENDKIIPYLSDDALDKLIMDIEEKELVQAPAGVERKVLSFIEFKKRRKTVEFSTYCLRVALAVAAAIALVCIVPFIPDTGADLPKREQVVTERDAVTREEVLSNRPSPSKEEVLNKSSNTDRLKETENFIESHIKSFFE